MELTKEIAQFKLKNRTTKRTTRTPNDLLIYGDYAEIVLRNNKQKIVGLVKIDLENVSVVKRYKWHITQRGYCEGYIHGKNIKMHRLLMDAQEGQIIDHINHDKLDNRKANLRFCTVKENNNNQLKREMQPIYIKKSDKRR